MGWSERLNPNSLWNLKRRWAAEEREKQREHERLRQELFLSKVERGEPVIIGNLATLLIIGCYIWNSILFFGVGDIKAGILSILFGIANAIMFLR